MQIDRSDEVQHVLEQVRDIRNGLTQAEENILAAFVRGRQHLVYPSKPSELAVPTVITVEECLWMLAYCDGVKKTAQRIRGVEMGRQDIHLDRTEEAEEWTIGVIQSFY